MGEAPVEINVTVSPREPFLLSTPGSIGSSGFTHNSTSNMTICPESSFTIGPSSSSSLSDIVTTSSPSGRQENEYFKELAELLQETLSRPDSLQGVNKPALMDLIKQLHQQAKDRKENAVQHEDVSSSGPILLASHVGPMILEALDGFFFVMNTDGFVEYVSQNVVKYLKYNQGDMLNKPIYNFVAAGDHDLFSRLLPDSVAWHLIGFSTTASGGGVGKERRSHKFMCRFLVNADGQSSASTSGASSSYENLQVSAISLPYPTDTHRDDDFSLSFNVTTDSQPCLVCVARRLPEKYSPVASGCEGCQFNVKCTSDGEIISVEFKDKTLKQLFPKDMHRVQLRSLCHPSDLPLLNSHLKEVVECGSQTLSQMRLLSPVANNFCLLLQVRSRHCTDCNLNIGGFYTSDHIHSDFTVIRLVDCSSSNVSAIAIDSKSYAANFGPLQCSTSSTYGSSLSGGNTFNGGYGGVNVTTDTLLNNNNNFDAFSDVFFPDDYVVSNTPGRNNSTLGQQQQPPTLYPQQNSVGLLGSSPKQQHGQLQHSLSKSGASFDISSASTPATPVCSSTVPGTPVRCPSALSEPVSSTGQDDLQRICQMFMISSDEYIIQQQPSSSSFVDYDSAGGSKTTETDSDKPVVVVVDQSKLTDQHVILKELLNQEEEQQQQIACGIYGTNPSPFLQHRPTPQALPPPPPPPPAAVVSNPSAEKPPKGAGRRGGGRRSTKKAAQTQILEQLLKPEPTTNNIPSPSGTWCQPSTATVIKTELGHPNSFAYEQSGHAPPAHQILQQLLQEEDPSASYHPVSSSGTILGKRKNASSASFTYDSLTPCGVSSPPTLVSSSTPSSSTGSAPNSQKGDSLLVKLLEKPSSQTRSLPTSIASTQFDKMAKENKENPNKPVVSTLIVESLLHKTKPHASKQTAVAGGVTPTPSSPVGINGGHLPISPSPTTPYGGSYAQPAPGVFVTQGYNGSSLPPVAPGYGGGSSFGDSSPYTETSRLTDQTTYGSQNAADHRSSFEIAPNLGLPSAKPMAPLAPPRFPVGSFLDLNGRAAFPGSLAMYPSTSSSSSAAPPAPRFPVTPTPPNVRQQILIQQQKRGKQHRQNSMAHNQPPPPLSAGAQPPSSQATAFPMPGYHCSAPSTPTGATSFAPSFAAPPAVHQPPFMLHGHGAPQPHNGGNEAFVNQQHFMMDPRFIQIPPSPHPAPVPQQHRLPQSLPPPPVPLNVPTPELVRHELRQTVQNRAHQQQQQQHVSTPVGMNRSMSTQQMQPQHQNWSWPERRMSQEYAGMMSNAPIEPQRLGLPGFPGAPQFTQQQSSNDQQQQLHYSHRTVGGVSSESNGVVPNPNQSQHYDNPWWNVDVGLENGLDMDDESTQNLLQMLRNS